MEYWKMHTYTITSRQLRRNLLINRFSQEVVDMIVDHLHDDYAALCNLDATSPIFRPACRYHLESQVALIICPALFKTLRCMVLDRPAYVARARTLILRGTTQAGQDGLPFYLQPRDIKLLLKFKGITTLKLVAARITTPEVFIQLVKGLPRLHTLCDGGGPFFEDYAWDEERMSVLSRPRLTHIRWGRELAHRPMFMYWLNHPQALEALQIISVVWGARSDVLLTKTILGWNPSKLKRLEITVEAKDLEKLDLGILRMYTTSPIERLDLNVTGDRSVLGHAIEALEHVRIPALKELHLNITWVSHEQTATWYDGDTELIVPIISIPYPDFRPTNPRAIELNDEFMFEPTAFPTLRRVVLNFGPVAGVRGADSIKQRFASAVRMGVVVEIWHHSEVPMVCPPFVPDGEYSW